MRPQSSQQAGSLGRNVLIGAVTLPLVVAVLFTVQDGADVWPWWESFGSGVLLGFVSIFAFVGAVLAGSWRTGNRITSICTLALLVIIGVWPTIALDTSPDVYFVLVGTVMVVIPFGVVALPTEYCYRTKDDGWTFTRVEGIAVLGGVFHLLFVDWVKRILERRPVLNFEAELSQADPTGLALFLGILVSLVLVVAVPLILTWRVRLASPLGIVSIAFGWATYETWRLSIRTLPPDGPGFGISPTPLTLYLWGSALLLVVAILFAGLEYGFRTRFDIAPPRPLFPDETSS